MSKRLTVEQKNDVRVGRLWTEMTGAPPKSDQWMPSKRNSSRNPNNAVLWSAQHEQFEKQFGEKTPTTAQIKSRWGSWKNYVARAKLSGDRTAA
jgi:hypothetical protein